MSYVIVGRSESKCGACRLGAIPDETGHYTLIGYGVPLNSKGCGVEWDYCMNVYVSTRWMVGRDDPIPRREGTDYER